MGVEWSEWSEVADEHHYLWPGYWIHGVAARLSANPSGEPADRAENSSGKRDAERGEPPSREGCDRD